MRPNNFLTVAFGVLLLFIRILRITGLTTQTVWQIKQQQHVYTFYANVQITKFTVPSHAVRSTWLFSSYLSDSDKRCEMESGFISIQYGGFPLVTPLNETYPPSFHLHRSYQVTLDFTTDNSTLSYRLENPVAGDWYVVSALDPVLTERIEQKGFKITCHYYMDIVHHIMIAEDVTTLTAGTTVSGLVQYEQAGLFRFLTEGSTTKCTIKISNCSCIGTNCSTSDSCPIRVSARSQAFPIPSRNGTPSINCSTSSDCQLDMEQPVTEDWQYVMVECLQHSNVSFNLTVDFEGCNWSYLMETQSSGSSVITMTTENPAFEKEVSDGYVRSAKHRPPEADVGDLSVLRDVTPGTPSVDEQVTSSPDSSTKATVNPFCLRLTDFGRFSEAEKRFSVTFRRRYGPYPMMNLFQMTGKEVVVAAFHVESLLDSGATLKLEANLLVSYLNNTSQIVVIEFCLVKFRIPFANGNLSCPPDSPLIAISSETGKNATAKVYVPYPESGVWFVGMAARCYGNVDLSKRVLEPCRLGPITVNSSVSLSPCVDKECAAFGSCGEYYSGVIHVSACHCSNGYRGYGCTDDTEAESDAYQLAYILLLTLSNLFFFPAIVVSIYRRFFTEATVYFFTMFFSSFYHACDGHSRYTLCIMPYHVLSFCDFLGSIVSFWVTIVTMARLPLHWTSFSYVVALLALSMGVQWDKHGLWIFLVPSVVALLIMTVAWGSRCWTRRAFYPSKRRWLFFLVPGICLASVGLLIFGFLETYDNYHYTHSAWHICMSTCIVFLLPPRPLRPIAKDDNLLSICVKKEEDDNDVRVLQISVPSEERQALQTDPLFVSPVSTRSKVSANGDIPPKDNSLEVPKDEGRQPQGDSVYVSPMSTRSASPDGAIPPVDNSSNRAIEENINKEITVL